MLKWTLQIDNDISYKGLHAIWKFELAAVYLEVKLVASPLFKRQYFAVVGKLKLRFMFFGLGVFGWVI